MPQLPPDALSVLVVDADSDHVEPRLRPPAGWPDGWAVGKAGAQSGSGPPDAVVVAAHAIESLQRLALRADLPRMTLDSAVVVFGAEADAAIEAELIGLGIEGFCDVSQPDQLPRQVRHAVARKRAECAARHAYATDLATGLPHEAQLIEHMAHLLALRERSPAPMVLVVLCVQGYADVAVRLGDEAVNVLRRKVAVRLRSGLRASDVVAAIDARSFGVLLGHLEAAADGARVAGKLVHALQQPFTVAGQSCRIATLAGLAVYPEHGRDAPTLLRRAVAQAVSVATVGAQGLGAMGEIQGQPAANDEGN